MVYIRCARRHAEMTVFVLSACNCWTASGVLFNC